MLFVIYIYQYKILKIAHHTISRKFHEIQLWITYYSKNTKIKFFLNSIILLLIHDDSVEISTFEFSILVSSARNCFACSNFRSIMRLVSRPSAIWNRIFVSHAKIGNRKSAKWKEAATLRPLPVAIVDSK